MASQSWDASLESTGHAVRDRPLSLIAALARSEGRGEDEPRLAHHGEGLHDQRQAHPCGDALLHAANVLLATHQLVGEDGPQHQGGHGDRRAHGLVERGVQREGSLDRGKRLREQHADVKEDESHLVMVHVALEIRESELATLLREEQWLSQCGHCNAQCGGGCDIGLKLDD